MIKDIRSIEILENRELLTTGMVEVMSTAAQENLQVITTHFDSIPNFAANPTIYATKDGNWSDTSIWSENRLPTANDIVKIQHNVIVDTNVDITSIGVSGTLTFADKNLNFYVNNFIVYENGYLEIGTKANPIQNDIHVIFKDNPINTNIDPYSWGNGLIVLGKISVYGNPVENTYTEINQNIISGDNVVVLNHSVDWHVGDEIYISDTRQLKEKERAGNLFSQSELNIIKNISSDGKIITFENSFQYSHFGSIDNKEFVPHLVNLTRNIVFSSENPNGTRGHTTYLGRADVDINYAQFTDMGRTRGDIPVDFTILNSDGSIKKLATNQIARYAVHTHHLIGPEFGQDNGYQFTINGISVNYTDPPHQNIRRWGITIHGSHYGLIANNVIYNARDAGIAFEDGSESFNVLENNFVGTVYSTQPRADAGAFWFRGPNNYVRNNIAADAQAPAEAPTNYGFTFNLQQLGNKAIPAFQGAMTHGPNAQTITVDMNGTPILQFENNEVYASQGGFTYWWINTYGGVNYNRDGGTTYLKNLSAWNIWKYGIYFYPVNDIVVDGLKLINDPTGMNIKYETNKGIEYSDYSVNKSLIQNFDIQGFRIGIQTSGLTTGDYILKNGNMENYENIVISVPWTVAGGQFLTDTSRRFIFEKITFANLPNINGGFNFSYRYETSNKVNLITNMEVYVVDFNKQLGYSFKLYADQQDPNFVIPMTGSTSNSTAKNYFVGSPESGLTNQQNKDKYGISVYGELMPNKTSFDIGVSGGKAFWIRQDIYGNNSLLYSLYGLLIFLTKNPDAFGYINNYFAE